MSGHTALRDREVVRVDRLWRPEGEKPLLVSFFLAEIHGRIACVGYGVRTFLAATVQDDDGPGDHWDVWVPPSWLANRSSRPSDFDRWLEALEAERPAFQMEAGNREDLAIGELGEPFQVNATLARSLPFGDLLNRAVRDYASRIETDGFLLSLLGGRECTHGSLTLCFSGSAEEGDRLQRLGNEVAGSPNAKRTDGDASGDATLQRIAKLYESFYRHGSRTPTRDVANALGMSRSTVAKRIMKCRHEGLLEPTTKGRSGGLLGDDRGTQ
ncbi:MAG: hypothetical protein R2826_05775 [Thermoleophilia bacterium]